MRERAHADVLDEVLGVGPVTREPVGRAKQRVGVRRDQAGEIGVACGFHRSPVPISASNTLGTRIGNAPMSGGSRGAGTRAACVQGPRARSASRGPTCCY